VIIERLLWGGPLELILGPPGSGKSTIAVAYLEWVLGRDPNYRWLIVSEVEHGVAAEHLRTIGDTIQNTVARVRARIGAGARGGNRLRVLATCSGRPLSGRPGCCR